MSIPSHHNSPALRNLICGLLAIQLGACAVNPEQDGNPSRSPTPSGASSSTVSQTTGEAIEPDICKFGGTFKTSQQKDYSTHYPPGLEQDNVSVSSYVRNAIDALRPGFTNTVKSDTESIGGFDVCIHAHSTTTAREGVVTLWIRGSRDNHHVSLHLLAPSRHENGGSTLMGEPFDELYFQRVITHEIGTLYLLNVVRNKPVGWSFEQAPSWFAEGYQEYLALNFSTEHARQVTQRLYLETVARSPKRVRLDLSVENPYVDGAVLVRFLNERYGSDSLHEVLASQQPDFWSAMKSVLGLTPESLDREFSIWMSLPENRAVSTAP